ncbi:hydrophobin-251 [Coprinopsis cinerea AmutBmut pab1-1]|nr:hydrophobin-251 [Coprinopsis cinerea AmutBmut pab1-1]
MLLGAVGVATLLLLLYYYFVPSRVCDQVDCLPVKVSIEDDIESWESEKIKESPRIDTDALALEVALNVGTTNDNLNAFVVDAPIGQAGPTVPTPAIPATRPSAPSKRCQPTPFPTKSISCPSPPIFPRHPSPCPSPLVPRWNRRRRAIVYAPKSPERSPRKWRRVNANSVYRHSSNAVYDLFYYGTVHHPRVVRLNPSVRKVLDTAPDPALIEMFMGFRRVVKAEGKDFNLPKPRV